MIGNKAFELRLITDNNEDIKVLPTEVPFEPLSTLLRTKQGGTPHHMVVDPLDGADGPWISQKKTAC